MAFMSHLAKLETNSNPEKHGFMNILKWVKYATSSRDDRKTLFLPCPYDRFA